ncbi:hypothetical protein B296_00026530, partial [Ensete ventricosum]
MAKGLASSATEDLAMNRVKDLSLYHQILRNLNSPELLLTHAARLAKKAEVRSIFLFGAEERSLLNIADLIDAANYFLSILQQGWVPLQDFPLLNPRLSRFDRRKLLSSPSSSSSSLILSKRNVTFSVVADGDAARGYGRLLRIGKESLNERFVLAYRDYLGM